MDNNYCLLIIAALVSSIASLTFSLYQRPACLYHLDSLNLVHCTMAAVLRQDQPIILRLWDSVLRIIIYM